MTDCQEARPGGLQNETTQQAEKDKDNSGKSESFRPPDFSDVGNAAVFTRKERNDLIFTDALGWLWWNGQKWERNEHKALDRAIRLSGKMLSEANAAQRAAQMRQAELLAEAARNPDGLDGKALDSAAQALRMAIAFRNHAQKLRNARQLNNMLELSKPYFVLKADRLDANPFDLNTPAGIVDLRTGKLRSHDRRAYCSRMTAASPGSQGAKMWMDFLDTITCRDYSVQGFLQMAAGMALIGEVYHEGILIAYGGGRNGKSTFFNALGEVLGDYAGTIDIRTLTTDRSNKGAALATLRGKRLVITGELEEHQRLSVATLKQVGSTDRLNIEEKFKQPESVKQTHTLVLFTNHLPRVGSTDSGTWRRLTVIPFQAVIPPQTGIQNYGSVLAREAGSAILAWAIQGAVNFIQNGCKLDLPDAVEEATEAYRQQEDWLNNFLDERCVRGPEARIGARALYLAYRTWAEESGEFIRRENDFSAAMENAGLRKVKITGRPTYKGIGLDAEACPARPWV